MTPIKINPDVPLWPEGPVFIRDLNATILFSWLVMAILVLSSWLITRRIDVGADAGETKLPRGRNLLEVLVSLLRNQVREVSQQDPGIYLPFVGTMFLFIAMSNLLSVVPGYHPPTGSLSTTAALATCVFIAVPIYGIANQGLGNYLRQYIRPSIFMLPFNVIGEMSRTLALAVRLYGNMLSGSVIGLVLLAFVPFFVPIVMQLFGLLTGMIQAYIFSILAMVYIASATRAHEASTGPSQQPGSQGE